MITSLEMFIPPSLDQNYGCLSIGTLEIYLKEAMLTPNSPTAKTC